MTLNCSHCQLWSWPTHMQRFKVNGQSFPRTESKQTDGQTVIVLPAASMWSVITVIVFSRGIDRWINRQSSRLTQCVGCGDEQRHCPACCWCCYHSDRRATASHQVRQMRDSTPTECDWTRGQGASAKIDQWTAATCRQAPTTTCCYSTHCNVRQCDQLLTCASKTFLFNSLNRHLYRTT